MTVYACWRARFTWSGPRMLSVCAFAFRINKRTDLSTVTAHHGPGRRAWPARSSCRDENECQLARRSLVGPRVRSRQCPQVAGPSARTAIVRLGSLASGIGATCAVSVRSALSSPVRKHQVQLSMLEVRFAEIRSSHDHLKPAQPGCQLFAKTHAAFIGPNTKTPLAVRNF